MRCMCQIRSMHWSKVGAGEPLSLLSLKGSMEWVAQVRSGGTEWVGWGRGESALIPAHADSWGDSSPQACVRAATETNALLSAHMLAYLMISVGQLGGRVA